MAVAVLVLGIGWAHETMHLRGITERALGWTCEPLTLDVRWVVRELTSMVVLRGEPAEVKQAVQTVTRRIAAGPGRLAPVPVPASGAPDAHLLRLRYGFQGYGLAGASRYGYRTADAAAVAGLLARVGAGTFVTVSGDVELEPVPFGAALPLPEPPRREWRSTPGAVAGPEGFAVGWLAERTPTAAVASQLMASVIAAAVPDPGPTVPRVLTEVRSIGTDRHHVGVVANPELAPEQVARVCHELERLRRNGPGVSEIVAAVDRQARSGSADELDEAVLRAERRLLQDCGYTLPPEAELDTDPAVLAETVARHCRTLLMTCTALPAGDLLPEATMLETLEPARGRTYRPARVMVEAGMQKSYRYLTSDNALTLRTDHDVTAAADGIVLVERFPDGERTVCTRDGSRFHVDPLVWRQGRRLVGWVDAHGADVTVDRPESLPAGRPVARAALRARPGFAVVTALLTAVLTVAFAVGAVTTPDQRPFLVVATVGAAAATAGLVYVVRYALRLQRRVAVRSTLY